MLDAEHARVQSMLQQDISRAVSILKEEGCSDIFLFGSTSHGAARPDSDIDLAIRGCPRADFFRILGRLLWELDHSVDLIDLDSPDPFAQHLQKEARLVRVG